jgi:hypothetical protein
MSRIYRYKESIDKFFKSKSFINDIDIIYKNHILDISLKNDYFISIVLLTVMNNVSKKNNLSLHGYFIASGIESLYLITTIYDNMHYYNNKIGTTAINNLKLLVNNNIYRSLSQNIDSISLYFQKEKIIKINSVVNKYITQKLEKINNTFDEPINIWQHNDFLKYKSYDKKYKNKLQNIKTYNKQDFLNYIDTLYGNICKITLISGYLLGGGDEKIIPKLEMLATYMSQLIKVATDFNNVDFDIENSNNCIYNSVVILGYQDAFEIFQTSKEKFVEGCMQLDIHTNTIKEIIDVLEERIDQFIDNTLTQSESI